jgi:hypothetical protein
MKKFLKVMAIIGIMIATVGLYSSTNKASAQSTMTVVISVTNSSAFDCSRNVVLTVQIGIFSQQISQPYVVGTTTYTFNNINADCDFITSGMSKKCSDLETIIVNSKRGPFTANSTQTLGVGITSD